MNILMHVNISRLTNHALEKFLADHYSENNVLIYRKDDDCDFSPLVVEKNIYSVDLMRKQRYRELPGYEMAEPVSLELMDKMGKYEGFIYEMLNGVFPPVERFSERQRIYHNALRFFNYLLEKNKIDIFINSGVPHQVYDYILYALCKCKGIKVVLMYRIFIRGYIYYLDDIYDHGLNFNTSCGKTLEDLSEDFRSEFEKYTKANAEVTPYYMKRHFFADKYNRIKALFSYSGLMSNFGTIIKCSLRHAKTVRYMKKNSGIPDYSKKYIYVGLHYQPEGTTSPMAGHFVNLQLMVEMISYSVPSDVLVYVKEHPSQRIRGEKDVAFYREINEMKNVIILPTQTSTFDLIENSIAVATCTGTIAYEAMYKNKAVLLFGYSLYNFLPNAFFVDSVESCKRAINKILGGFSVSRQEMIDFMYSVQNMSYQAEFGFDHIEYLNSIDGDFEYNNTNFLKLLTDCLQIY